MVHVCCNWILKWNAHAEFYCLGDAEGRYVERTLSHVESLSLICRLFVLQYVT